MIDVQKLVNGLGDVMREVRSDYHLTLGQAIDIASQARGYVRFAHGGYPGRETTYRGYYSDLAFEPIDVPRGATEFLTQCQAALGNSYKGYKGGTFRINDKTPLWRAPWGVATGDAIIDATISIKGDLVLHCKTIPIA